MVLVVLAKLVGVYLVVLAGTNIHLYWYARLCSWGLEDADMRLALFGDPQMEGDSKLLRQPEFGWLDLAFNDAYTRHIYESILGTMSPTHAISMGDLFSSQYISDAEFLARTKRYNRAFEMDAGKITKVNMTGNHDIGYGEDVTIERVGRFERAFGPVNAEWVEGTGVRVVVINAMVLESAHHRVLRDQTWAHLQRVTVLQAQDPRPLLLLSHVPLHKPAGVCYDPPEVLWRYGQVYSQTHLSEVATDWILQHVRPTWVLAGHDHEGCMTRHRVYWDGQGGVDQWVRREGEEAVAPPYQHLLWETREMTVRSMMGDYGGHTGLLAGRRDGNGGWRWETSRCALGHHVVVRVVLIMDAVVLGIIALGVVLFGIYRLTR